MKKPQVILHTDGACTPQTGNGGWACILKSAHGDYKRAVSGASRNTTNNQMELTAVIQGLKSLKIPCELTIYTDSLYVLKGATEWSVGWIARGWRTANKSPVKNRALWQELLALLKKHEYTFVWVKGHNGDPLNEQADALAVSRKNEL